MMYQENYCFNCVNWRDKKDGRGEGCPIWDLHLTFNNTKSKEIQEILDEFIPRKGIVNEECTMFQKEKRC